MELIPNTPDDAVILISDSFLSALAVLDPADVKRVVLFLDKLLRLPTAAGMRPEIVHDAADRHVRSYKVTHDLRALAHVDGETVVLLFVARHDRAYVWARTRCIDCHPVAGERRLLSIEADEGDAHLPTWLCESTVRICRLLEERGISYEPLD